MVPSRRDIPESGTRRASAGSPIGEPGSGGSAHPADAPAVEAAFLETTSGFARPPRQRCVSRNARMVLAFGVSVLYATCFVAIKTGLLYAPPLRFGGLRLLIGGAALLGVVWVRREPLLPHFRTWPWLLPLALTAGTVTYAAMFLSPRFTGAGIASVLGNAQPLFAVALAGVFLGERITRAKLVALVLGLAGMLAIAFPELTVPNAFAFWGALLAMGASVGSATGSVIIKHIGPSSRLLTVTAWSLLLGSLPLLSGSAVVESGARTTWNVTFVALLLFLALAGTALTSALWYWLVQQDEVGRLTLFLFLVPILGLALAAGFFGERLDLVEELGVTLTIAGIGAVAWESRHSTGDDARPVPGLTAHPDQQPSLDRFTSPSGREDDRHQ